MNTPSITVSEAEIEFGLKSHTIRRWIRAKQVQAKKVGDTYQIDRDSLTRHLATTKGAKIDEGENPVSIPEVPTTSQQGRGIIAPGSSDAEGPGDTGPGAEAAAKPSPQRESKPPLAKGKGRPAQGKAPKRNRHLPKACRKPKKFRKGPVRYAKDIMRKFDVAQLRDVREWLTRRMDERLKLV
jgi:hypothetical protein